MSDSAAEMDGESGRAEPPAGPPSANPPPEARTLQADKLTRTAKTLEEEAERMKLSFPAEDQDPMIFWKSDLDDVQSYLTQLKELLKDCQLLVKQMDEAKQAADAATATVEDEGKAKEEDAAQKELNALHDQLTHFGKALELAYVTANATLAALRGRASHRARSMAHKRAADELAEMAGHCQALATLLAGETGLPGYV